MGSSSKKIVVALLLILLGGLFSLAISAWFKSRGARYAVGLVYVPSRAFHEQVNSILIDTIKRDDRFSVKGFTSGSTSDLIQVNIACDDALASEVNLIISTGLNCSKGLAQISRRRKSAKPVVFLGLLDPVRYELVESVEKPGHNVTGIESNSPGSEIFSMLDLLLIAKPLARRILLPYSIAAGGFDLHVEQFKKDGKKMGLEVTILPINSVNDTLQHVAGLISSYDTLMYLEADGISVYGPALGKLASQHGVTMFAGSLDGIKDSALSFVPDLDALASEAFDLAKEILINQKNPGDLPVRQMTVPRNLVINTKLCKEQDLDDIDIQRIIAAIRADDRFALVHDHIVVT
ncbi:MAG: putative tryptophan/tyrosine transport system substrate-binding protein [Candidatus Dependentiae bacterium]|nr:putative tryptophan/tyrosine transport system substrate-binding protein [Candidatus Dependentiae bacterium]